MGEDHRKRQEICRGVLSETEHNLRIVFQFHTPVPLETSTHDKFDEQFWLLPPDVADTIGKVYGKVEELNDLLPQSNSAALFRKNDLWGYLRADLQELERKLREYDAGLRSERGGGPPKIAMDTKKVAVKPQNTPEWDIFICHASEDKREVAGPLTEALAKKGLRVWYDEFTLTLGDSLSRSIDNGLANSRFGVVILSPSFFKKEWPRRELDGLTAKEATSGKTILPVWHKVNRAYIVQYSPILADKYAVSTDNGLMKVVDELLKAISKARSGSSPSSAAPVGSIRQTKTETTIEGMGGAKLSGIPLVRIGEQISSVTGTHQLSLTLLWWKESGICVNGPYGSGYYTFTAKLGMKFVIIAYVFRNNWIREQTTPYLNNGEITTHKGYIYAVWSPLGGVNAKGYAARQATTEEVENLIGTSGAFEKLLPEESCAGCVVFEVPKDATPVEAILSNVPLAFRFEKQEDSIGGPGRY